MKGNLRLDMLAVLIVIVMISSLVMMFSYQFESGLANVTVWLAS